MTQSPLQLVSPVWQDSEHLPALQTSPAFHTVPQAPQLVMSVWRLTQVPEQLFSPLWQDNVHLPAEQTSPALQVLPHEPQL